MTKQPRKIDTFRWCLAIGAALIAGGYLAWLIIPFVVKSHLGAGAKTGLIAVLGAMPLLTKLLAIVLIGRPTIEFLKKHSLSMFRRDRR